MPDCVLAPSLNLLKYLAYFDVGKLQRMSCGFVTISAWDECLCVAWLHGDHVDNAIYYRLR